MHAILLMIKGDACNPINDKRGTVDYRTKVAGVLFKRATNLAAERIRGN